MAEEKTVKSDSRGIRKERVGVVTSNKMDKTIVVTVDRLARHKRYKKVIKISKKYYAHDENNEANKQYKSREILLNMISSTKEEYDRARKKFSLEKESEQKQVSHLKSDTNIGRNIDFTI